MDILLIINIYISDKFYWHLIETEKLSPPLGPPLLQSFISMESSQDNGKLGKSINGCSKDKGMQTQVCKNGVQIHYSFFSLTISPPLMHPISSIYSPSIGSEGSSWSVSRHMEGQRSSYSWHNEENSKIFIFGHISRCTRFTVGQAACTCDL